MRAIGPVQLIAIGFEPTDRCRRRIRRELRELDGRGIVRVLDMLVVQKDSQGTITRLSGFQPTNDKLESAGQVLGILIGLDTHDSAISPSTDVGALAFAEHNYGLSRKDIMDILERLAPGTGAALLLIEHPWALRLKAAMLAAGAWMLAQNFVTPETLLWVGDEVQAISEAETVIELAGAVKGAALLEALADVAEDQAGLDEAAAISAAAAGTAAAVKAIRALIVGGLIAEAAAKEAIGVLAGAGLIAEATIAEAARRAEQVALETQAAIIAVEEVPQGPLR